MGGELTSAELFDENRGFEEDWRPVISNVPNPSISGTQIEVTGNLFTGLHGNGPEGSGGTYNNSATNFPLLQLHRIENDEMIYLPIDPDVGFSETYFLSSSSWTLNDGPAIATIITNSIPSESLYLNIAPDNDNDGVADPIDNCPITYNPDQTDEDSDEIGDECDNCPDISNSDQSDGDGDDIGDLCDSCPDVANPNQGENTITGHVWLDDGEGGGTAGDGIKDPGESGIVMVPIILYDDSFAMIKVAITTFDGTYSFSDLCPGQFFIEVFIPAGFTFTLQNEGSDDAVDSDVDRISGTAGPIDVTDGCSIEHWDAGLILGCNAPDEPLYLYLVTKDLQNNPILHFSDPNQPSDITGYNIYRSNDSSIEPVTDWPKVADNVVDQDEGSPNIQWVDISGDDPGEGKIWFYQVKPYNAICDAEGP